MKSLYCLLALVLAFVLADTANAGGYGAAQLRFRQARFRAPIVVRQQFNYGYAAPLNFGYQQQFRQLQFNSGGYCDPFAGQFRQQQFRLQFSGY